MTRIEDRTIDAHDTSAAPSLSRRDFMRVIGGGIVVLFAVGEPSLLEAQRGRGEPLPDDFNAFLRIGEDGRVSCFTGKIEMGQGVVTSLAMMLADELEVPLESVDMVMGDTALCPWDAGTWGSQSTRIFGPPLRAAAAEARATLIALASEALQTPASELTARDGVVYRTKQKDKKVSYAQLAKGKAIVRRAGTRGAPEAPSGFTIVGTSVSRRDAVDKVTGRAKYAGDLREPGMLYARVLRPPAHDAKLVSADTSQVKTIAGATLIDQDGLIAALHEDPELAELALGKIQARWDRPPAEVDDRTIFDHLLKVAPPGQTISEGGNLDAGSKASRTVVERTYLNAYVAHAPIETHTALAKVDGDRVTVWASTQSPFGIREEVASALGLPTDHVHVITPFVGGGFGGKGTNHQAAEAARLSRLTGRPVQVTLSRPEEFFYDTFRPAAVVKIRGGVTSAGAISLWDYAVYFAGDRGAQHFYDVPHHRTVAHGSGWRGQPGSHPFATGPWRAPGNNTNTFARESHVDLLARAAGMDPVEFRLRNLKDERMIRALKTAAAGFGWKPGKSPSGRGWGVACGIDSGTYVAHMCEVEADKKTGQVQVKRVTCAQDMGLVVNPEGARIQIEGCITMGLGYALAEGMHFKGGEVLDTNFDRYTLPRFSWLPQIQTILINDRNAAPQGGGEPAIICMGAVIANAIDDAIGARVCELPMTPERVLRAAG
ncbi:MAG TPA: molybdopterin cofactor-binding domain-containing protein [Candidatus Eisenbacteria bacterium]